MIESLVLGLTLPLLALFGFAVFRYVALTPGGGRKAAREDEQYRLLVDNSADLIIRFSQKFVPLYVSPASRTLLGCKPEEIMGDRPLAFVHPDDLNGLQTLTKLAEFGASDAATRTLRLRHKNGRYVWVEASYRLIRDKDTPRKYDILVVCRDMTERLASASAIAESEARY